MTRMDPQHPAKPYAPRPLFLAPGAAAGDGTGYRNKPFREPPLHEQVSSETLERIRAATSVTDEPEALDRDDWDRFISTEVDQRAKARVIEREREAHRLSQQERLERCQKDAAAQRRDIRREVWVIRQMQAKKRPPEVVEKRLQALERIVYLGRAA